MLISNHGTGGDADDRDVIQGNFGCPNLLNLFYLNHIFKYPRVWDRVPIQLQSPKATFKPYEKYTCRGVL